MKKILIIFLFSVGAGSLFSQEMSKGFNDAAYPALGWDTLKSMIVYPEIARRTGIEGVSNVEVHLDSVGNILFVNITGNPMFNGVIQDAVRDIYWQPSLDNYKVRSSTVYFDVEFKYKNSKIPQKRKFIIETQKP